jgi:DNA primase catalytic core
VAQRVTAGAARTAELLAQETPATAIPVPVEPHARLLAANAAAAEFYRAQYPRSWAPEYLAIRLGWAGQLPLDRLGYAPGGWAALVSHLLHEGFSEDELLISGLATRASTGRLIDRFRDRLMFPILTAGPHDQPRVVAFVGRRNPALDTAENPPPKYLNTPETPVFSKAGVLFGLAENAERLTRGALAVLVEGPLDTLAVDLASGGELAGVAPLGTAFTSPQATALSVALSPGTDRVVVATDGDVAGHKAAAHAFDLLTSLGIDPRGAGLPEGSDPAALAETSGPWTLVERLTAAEPLARQVAVRAVEGRDLRWAETRVAAARAVASIVMRAPASTWQREIDAVSTCTGLQLAALMPLMVDRLLMTNGPTGHVPKLVGQQGQHDQKPALGFTGCKRSRCR